MERIVGFRAGKERKDRKKMVSIVNERVLTILPKPRTQGKETPYSRQPKQKGKKAKKKHILIHRRIMPPPIKLRWDNNIARIAPNASNGTEVEK